MKDFRDRYSQLVRMLRKRKEVSLGEICMSWNCGPDAALKMIKTMKGFDPHIEIKGRGLENKKVVWIEKPYDLEAILEDVEEVKACESRSQE